MAQDPFACISPVSVLHHSFYFPPCALPNLSQVPQGRHWAWPHLITSWEQPQPKISAVILSCTPLLTLPQQDDDGAGSIITGRRGGKEDFICFCFLSKQSISLHWASSQISVLAPAIPRAEVSGLSAERLCWCRAASSASDKAGEFYPLPKTGWGLGQGEKRLAQWHGGTWGQCLCHSTAPWARENKIPPCPGTETDRGATIFHFHLSHSLDFSLGGQWSSNPLTCHTPSHKCAN